MKGISGLQAGIGVLSTLGLILIPLAGLAQPRLSGSVPVVDAPQFSYRVEEVHFAKPRNISIGARVIQRAEMVRVVVKGVGFRPRATGPVVWLNGVPTLRTLVSDDGTALEAWFLESIQEFDVAAAQLGRWELMVQPHEGAGQVFRISPSGHPTDAGTRPAITPHWESADQDREEKGQLVPVTPGPGQADVATLPPVSPGETLGGDGLQEEKEQATPGPPAGPPSEAGGQVVAVLPTLNPPELEEAMAHGRSKGSNFMELVREYAFGSTQEPAWGYILTKRYRVALEAMREGWKGSQPDADIIQQILNEDLLVVRIQFTGEQSSPPTLVLKQGDALIKPTTTRGFYFAFPYASVDLNARTTMIFTAGAHRFQWEVDLSQYK